MTRDWKKTGEPIENAYYCWEDLILEDKFGITEEDWNTVIEGNRRSMFVVGLNKTIAGTRLLA